MSGHVIVGDFETYYAQGKYSLSGVRKLSTLQYITDERFTAQSLATLNLNTGEQRFSWYGDITEHVRSLDLPNNTFVAHNNYFDGGILAWRYGVIPRQYVCTRLMSMAVLGTELKSHSLSFVAEHLGCAPKLKSMLNEFMGVQYIDGDPNDRESPAGRMKIYNEQDVATTAQVLGEFAQLFPASQWWHMDWALRQFCNPVLRLDSELLERTAREAESSDRTLYERIGIPKRDFTSAGKFCDLLRVAGIEPPMKHSPKQDTMIPALSKTDLEFEALKTHELPAVRNLCALRAHAASNILLTRARSLHANSEQLHDNTWPMHVLYSGAMQTHRLSGSDGAGGNPLNLPRGSVLRNAILPARQHRLYVSDQSSFELRIARQLARDERALALLYNGGDLYCDFASEVYKRPITKADKKERQVGKVASLSLQYSTGHVKLVGVLRLQGVDMDLARGKAIVDLFRYQVHKPVQECWQYFDRQVLPRMLSGQRGYQLDCAPFIHTDGTALVLPSGLKLNFRGLKYGDDGLRYLSYSAARKSPYDRLYAGKIFQYCCQSLANEVLMVQKQRIEAETGCRVVLEVYDELAVMVPVQEQAAMDQIAAKVDEIMCSSPTFWPELRLQNDAAWGDRYGDAKT